jgi:hypothetical protein
LNGITGIDIHGWGRFRKHKVSSACHRGFGGRNDGDPKIFELKGNVLFKDVGEFGAFLLHLGVRGIILVLAGNVVNHAHGFKDADTKTLVMHRHIDAPQIFRKGLKHRPPFLVPVDGK